MQDYNDTMLEAYQGMGFNPKLCSKSSEEYHGPCPKCGGEDRFRLILNNPKYPHGYFTCRQCGFWGTSVQDLLGTSKKPHRTALCSYRRMGSVSISTAEYKPMGKTVKDKALTEDTERLYSEKGLPYMNYLEARGITRETAQQCKLGYNMSRKAISIPHFREGQLIALKFRLLDETQGKYRIEPGSASAPYIIPSQTEGNTSILIVESELDAILLSQELGNLYTYIALGSASVKPDKQCAELIRQASDVFFCYDNDEAGKNAMQRWKSCFPQIQPAHLPIGKDPTEAFQHGISLKEFGYGLRGIAGRKPYVPQSIYIQHSVITTLQDLESFLSQVKHKQPEHPVLGLYIEDYTFTLSDSVYCVSAKLSEVRLEESTELKGFTLVVHNAWYLRSRYKELHGLPLFECTHLQAVALGIDSERKFDDLVNTMLERCTYPNVPASCRNASELVRLFKALDSRLKQDSLAKNYYDTLYKNQIPCAEMQRNGLLIDRQTWKNTVSTEQGIPKWCNLSIPADNRIRTTLHPHGTATGRIVTKEYPLQGIPKVLRSSVIASPGYVLLSADYSQFELRIAAAISKDSKMLKAFQSHNTDIYKTVMAQIKHISLEEVTSEHRKEGKKIVLRALYGSKVLPEFILSYPELAKWITMQKNSAREAYSARKPVIVQTCTGRKIPINTNTSNWINFVANYPIQGTGADILLKAIELLHIRLANTGTRLLLPIHDEILLECPDEEKNTVMEITRQCMHEAFYDIIKCDCGDVCKIGSGRTWLEAK